MPVVNVHRPVYAVKLKDVLAGDILTVMTERTRVCVCKGDYNSRIRIDSFRLFHATLSSSTPKVACNPNPSIIAHSYLHFFTFLYWYLPLSRSFLKKNDLKNQLRTEAKLRVRSTPNAGLDRPHSHLLFLFPPVDSHASLSLSCRQLKKKCMTSSLSHSSGLKVQRFSRTTLCRKGG